MDHHVLNYILLDDCVYLVGTRCFTTHDTKGLTAIVTPLPGIKNGQTQGSGPTSQTTIMPCQGLGEMYDAPDPWYGCWSVWGIMYK